MRIRVLYLRKITFSELFFNSRDYQWLCKNSHYKAKDESHPLKIAVVQSQSTEHILKQGKPISEQHLIIDWIT